MANNKKESLNVKKQFKEAFVYLKQSASFIWISLALFIIGASASFLSPENFVFLDNFIAELLRKTADLNALETVFFILQNNLQSALFSILLGIFFGVFPVISILTNGAVIGYVLALTLQTEGISSWWRLIPHGIFELPAIFISFGLGIKLGVSFFRKKELKKRFYNSVNVFLMIVIPLLIAAAIIEGLLISFLRAS